MYIYISLLVIISFTKKKISKRERKKAKKKKRLNILLSAFLKQRIKRIDITLQHIIIMIKTLVYRLIIYISLITSTNYKILLK